MVILNLMLCADEQRFDEMDYSVPHTTHKNSFNMYSYYVTIGLRDFYIIAHASLFTPLL